MTEQTPRVICIGEAAIELRRGPDGAFSAACAGDSFNTAVYLARAGLNVGFATAVGDDPYSDSIVALALADSGLISFCAYLAACRRCPWSSMASPANPSAAFGATARQRANCLSLPTGCASRIAL